MTHTRHARACSPPLSHGVLHLFLTLLLAYGAVASHLGRCEQLLPYGKLATSSFSYAKRSKTQEYYESAVVSSKNLCETRIIPALRHKTLFPYEFSIDETGRRAHAWRLGGAWQICRG